MCLYLKINERLYPFSFFPKKPLHIENVGNHTQCLSPNLKVNRSGRNNHMSLIDGHIYSVSLESGSLDGGKD